VFERIASCADGRERRSDTTRADDQHSHDPRVLCPRES
jgi:hypothetical protein